MTVYLDPDDVCGTCGHTVSAHLGGVAGGECLTVIAHVSSPAHWATTYCKCEGFVVAVERGGDDWGRTRRAEPATPTEGAPA